MSRAGSLLNNRYRLEAELGQGNFATVYLATDLGQPGQVAVKLLDQHWPTDAAFLERFLIQARLLLGLNHPNILPIADFGVIDTTPFLVMPFLRGGTLLTRLRQHPLSLGEIEIYLEQIVRALDYAHQRGIIHGDLKPGNVLLAGEGRVMVTDFGLATLLNNPAGQKTPSVAIGNPAYMAPEQFQGYTFPASDLYAAGILLFQLLTEKIPFRGSFEQIAAGHARRSPPTLASTAPALPIDPAIRQGLDRVISKALAKQPVDRYPTGQQLSQAYREAIKAAPVAQAVEADDDFVTPVYPLPRQNKPKVAEAVDATVRASPEPPAKPVLAPAPPVAPLTRYLDVRFPEQLQSGQQGWLEISLTLTEAAVAKIAWGEDSGEVVQGNLAPLTVNLNAPGFALESPPTQELELLPNRNSGPLKFLLTAPDPGPQSLSLNFWQHGKFAGRIELSAEIVKGQGGAKPLRGRAIIRRRFHPPDPANPPPDLQIYINSSPLPDGSRLLDFSLTYFENRRAVVAEPAGRLKLDGDLTTRLKNLFKRLNTLIQQSQVAGRNLSDQDIQSELERLGQNIYRDYFPPEFKAAYRKFRRNAHTLLIISNETGLPWELAYPYDESSEKAWQDGFLCERFVVSRWLADAPGLPGRVPLTVACCVVPTSNLNSAQETLGFLRRQSQQPNFRLVTPFLSHKSEVLNRLEQGEVNLIQFICRADADKLRLEGGEEFLSPADLSEKIEESLAKTKPFIFFNLCRRDGPDFAPLEIGAWAERLLRAGSSALLGAYWEVNDKLAAEFSRIFYEELFGGATFGEACAVARQHIRKFDPANSSWLAYTLYANPTARL